MHRNRRVTDDVFGSLVFALIAAGMGFAACLFAYRVADRTPDVALEAFVGTFGLLMLFISLANFHSAHAKWKSCDERLARVIRPVERKLPITFDD